MTSANISLAYDLVEAEGRPAVLIHALMGNRGFMDSIGQFWRQEHGATLAVDLPGHGESPMPLEPISISDSAKQVVALIKQQGLQDPIVIGHSMGGLVALEVAAQVPESVAGVILLDPAPIVFDDATRQGWSGLYEMLSGEGYQDAKAMIIDGQAGPYDNKQAVVSRADVFEKVAPEALIQSFSSMLQWNGAEALAKVKAPVAGFWGGRNAEPDVLLEHKADALIGQVVASGHYIHLEAREQVEAMINQALKVWAL
ncbi:alpha/beta hydrolase [Pseudomaricurvus alkylphenolicus]|uniref:alpha/beta fold hydrolase n=1 Tax=Pseudomaricurvus alkylphenolicus TaxID=1306991 RepID=UPI00142293FC|nr:alpha/beta hydrolase [Pseudomaricurvus alkylphenolicus]NIB44889.1 alpha/beta hydrolase [Pseudomaricurvus alkylphenolicus]